MDPASLTLTQLNYVAKFESWIKFARQKSLSKNTVKMNLLIHQSTS